jgi:hypothetical protein
MECTRDIFADPQMMGIDFEGGTTKHAYSRAFESQYQAEVIAKTDIIGHQIDSRQNRKRLRDEELEVVSEQGRPFARRVGCM